MSSFNVDRERILVFPVDDGYLFRKYFEHTDLFEQLREYYNDSAYRFEVPREAFDDVAEILREAYFEPVTVDDIDEYCVVKEQYQEYAPILRLSVMHWERRGYNFFVMKDELSVEEAIERGATRLSEADLVSGL